MKLLFDEKLSPTLVVEVADVFQGSVHVRDVGLKSAADRRVWDYAVEMGFAIVTKDADFRQRSFLFGPPPKLVKLDRSRKLLDETDRGATSQTKQRS